MTVAVQDTTQLHEMRGHLHRLRNKFVARDQRMNRIAMARQPGGLALVYPDLFPTDGPYTEPMVANMVDIAARDTSEVIAPLPAFNCSSSLSVSDRARRFSDRRTKIAYGYVDASRLQIQMYTAADRYVTYGFVVGMVMLDLDRNMPVIKFLDSTGVYLQRDRWGRIQRLFQVMQVAYDDAIAQFPHLRNWLGQHGRATGNLIELVRFHDADTDGVFCNVADGMMCAQTRNPVGEVLAHVFSRPGLADEEVGQFDDVLAVQVAKARFALLTLEAAQKSVEAPIAMPMDIQELSIGPDAIIKSSFPEKIRRVDLNISPVAFTQQRELDNELRQGSRYPDVRTGNTDASIVTGRGVQALMSGFDTQIKTAQAVFAEGLQFLMSKCFAVEEKVWPNRTREIRGNANGTAYQLTYTPAKDIKGDHTIDVQYGLMAGLNPNQALVFGLQARGDKLISRDFLRRQMPFSLDATEEEQKVDIEELRDSLKQAVAGYAQSIPMLAQQGQDPGQVLARMAAIINDRQKGIAVEESIAKAFAPEPETAPETGLEGGVEEPGQAGPGGAGGLMDGLMPGVAPGQAGMAPGGKPDLMTLLAGVGAGGKAGLQAGVSRRLPV